MTPGMATQDGLNSRVTYAVFPGQLGRGYILSRVIHWRPAGSADFAHLLFRQLRLVVGLANWPKSMLVGMPHVAALRHPLKILDAVIPLAPVLVVSNVSCWARANEGLKHELMNKNAFPLAAFIENNRVIAVGWVGTENPACTLGPNATVATDLIRPINNVFPRFCHGSSISREVTTCLP